jgi:hypothetical protein
MSFFVKGWVGRRLQVNRTSNMTGCDEYQLALEMHRHGAVSSISSEEIAQHIDGCSSCSSYRDHTKDVSSMTTSTLLSREPIDLSVIREHVAREANKLRKRWWPVPLGIGLIIALRALAGFGIDPWSILTMAGLAVWTQWRLAARRRALLVAQHGTETELLDGLRRYVDDQIRQLRFGATVTGLVVAACAGAVLAASWDIGRFVALPLLALGLATLAMARVRVRSLSRERAQLDA